MAPMGTWAAGPFGNDKGLDYIGRTTDGLLETIFEFIDAPRIDVNFDEAFAALALLNILGEKVRAPLPSAAEVDVWKRIFLHTYDSQIDELAPDGAYKRAHRQSIEKEFGQLLAACRKQADGEEGQALGRLGRLLWRAHGQRDSYAVNYREISSWVVDFRDDLERAWNACPNGDWLIGMATALGVPTKVLMPAVVALVTPVLSRIPEGEQRPAEALHTAERWAQGSSKGAECQQALKGARAAAKALEAVPAAAARAAMSLAQAAVDAAAGRAALVNDALTTAVQEYALALQIEARRAGKHEGVVRAAAMEAAAPFLRERIPWSAVHQAFVGPRPR